MTKRNLLLASALIFFSSTALARDFFACMSAVNLQSLTYLRGSDPERGTSGWFEADGKDMLFYEIPADAARDKDGNAYILIYNSHTNGGESFVARKDNSVFKADSVANIEKKAAIEKSLEPTKVKAVPASEKAIKAMMPKFREALRARLSELQKIFESDKNCNSKNLQKTLSGYSTKEEALRSVKTTHKLFLQSAGKLEACASLSQDADFKKVWQALRKTLDNCAHISGEAQKRLEKELGYAREDDAPRAGH